jgi:phosphatidylinositol alpha-1,6-mannosyltransferase
MVTRNFPPLTGGMERLNYHAFLALREAFDVVLCGPAGCRDYAAGTICREFPPAPPWRYVAGSVWSSAAMARGLLPDLVYAGSGLAAPAAWLAGRIARAPLAVYLHGLDIVVPSPMYQALCLPTIRRCDAFFANSGNTARLAVGSGIRRNNLAIVHPGVVLSDFSQRDTQRRAFRERFPLGERPLLLAAGRLTPRKGLVEFIERSLPPIIAVQPETCLLVIGAAPAYALGKGAPDIMANIHAAVARLDLHDHVHLLGKTDDATLSAAYFGADLFIFPMIDLPGDVEGFGMVAVEAAAHGLQTTGFAAGGVPDVVVEGISGWLLQPGDYPGLTEGVLRCWSREVACPPASCRQYAERFSWERFGAEMRMTCLCIAKQAMEARHG